MPKLSFTVPHSHDPAIAVEMVQPALEKTIKDFEGRDAEINWSGNEADYKFKSLAFTITGHMAVSDNEVQIDIDLPFAALMFKDKVGKAITKNLGRALQSDPSS
ncbi:MAG: polyhydroxyalkanoic acid system family protein [Pirellulaceae bacterium]|nr:polyhydroxyalkanoic acid system family protein [Planctomycetales bacterium]